ncbi:exopolygalacturonase-like [Tasmannia lanceolata]|uniref:exopolygalacturonase-like n=1 Tax=Tasmannia lanceolata TaxID=3420 RepID=UPI0040644E9C
MLVIPKAHYLVGPMQFRGPCRKVTSLTVNMQGYLRASTDLRKYGPTDEWVEFGWVDRLTLTGGGTFDGQGVHSWPYNKCPKQLKCKLLPTSIKFVSMTNTIVRNIASVNSKFFHIALVGCHGFAGGNIRISAPANSPNTDGIHMERSTGVTIYSSSISTGDDCVSIGNGCSHVSISGVTCGPGHGFSIGSLGRYPNEQDVHGVVIRDSSVQGTTNGVRIKTWSGSPAKTTASNLTFDNIIMTNVMNPIIIDQTYCPYVSCASSTPSRVKLSNISFKNIRGTSASQIAVTLRCSKGMPCENVNLKNVHLTYAHGDLAASLCTNAKVKYSGTQLPAPCID